MARITITIESRAQGNVSITRGDLDSPDTAHDIHQQLHAAITTVRAAYQIRSDT